ncbi:hypothetical protein pipiens_017556, partial [Culex pipiens pipiens]
MWLVWIRLQWLNHAFRFFK